jgi:3-phosphoshikimate 1-carboxyvinyltransferase
MKTITVIKNNKILKGKLKLPSSKSLSKLLLIIQALSHDQFLINNLSDADDTYLLQELLKKIRDRKLLQSYVELDTANAGTAMRFLTAYLTFIPGKWILTGSERMKQRPIGILVEAMRLLDAEIEYLGKLGYPPLMIKGRPLKGGEIKVDAGISSQFISALLLIAPTLPGGLSIQLQGQAVSFPYIDMTLRLLKYFGIETVKERNIIFVPEATIKGLNYTVEADWSAASFWYEAAAMADEVDLILEGLQKNSLQGDAILADIFQNFGIMSEFLKNGVRLIKVKKKLDDYYFDFSDYPDIAPAVITTCAALGLHGRFEGLKSLRIKETDRLKAIKNEYKKLGLNLEPDSPVDMMPKIEFINPQFKASTDFRIDTYGDHRMAMTFAPLSMKLGAIRIENPDVVSKSYPQYWEHLSSLGFEIVLETT